MHKAYVDGSFINGNTGYGYVVVFEDKVVRKESGFVPSDGSHRQVSGEIEAVKRLISWCKDNLITNIIIHYDYEGVASWAQGKWKTNITLTKEYAAFMKESGIDIKWIKVKAHSGDEYNEIADSLAKEGAMSKPSSDDNENERISYAEIFSKIIMNEGLAVARTEKQGYSRLEIYIGKEKLGMADIYFKKKGGLKIDVRGFKDDYYKERVLTVWNSFLSSI
ncbi:MAG: hypothetical protein KA015_00505 [Spirochaetes bacterium]|nr:hypothetical protein [Spirochaetota bacterium]